MVGELLLFCLPEVNLLASGERVMVKVDVAVGFTSSTVEAGMSVPSSALWKQ